MDIYGESTPKYQWAYEGNESNVATYGRLYTWYAVTDSRNVCPVGWHIPSDAEWTELTDYLGGDSIAGGKLKEVGLTHWISPNEGASNSSGFTALPCGFRYPDGAFHSIGDYGIWWSATEGGAANAWDRYIYCGCACVGRYDDVREAGFSVRLVRDN